MCGCEYVVLVVWTWCEVWGKVMYGVARCDVDVATGVRQPLNGGTELVLLDGKRIYFIPLGAGLLRSAVGQMHRQRNDHLACRSSNINNNKNNHTKYFLGEYSLGRLVCLS